MTQLTRKQLSEAMRVIGRKGGKARARSLNSTRRQAQREEEVMDKRATEAEELLREGMVKDAARYQWLRPYLKVAADGPNSLTCWLALDCIPFRSTTENAEELLTELMKRFPLNTALAASEEKEKP